MSPLLKRFIERNVILEQDLVNLSVAASHELDHLRRVHSAQDSQGDFGGRTVKALRRVLRSLGFTPGFRSFDSVKFETEFFSSVKEDSLCVSVGGGPKRVHPQFLNLNVGPFYNVDIIGDAHSLPFNSESIDFIYIDAVLEHLKDPQRAVFEMFRVLKPGGEVFSITPFLQGYHGYPDHYQNFTITGHEELYRRVGFRLYRSGLDLGPVNAFSLQLRMFVLTVVSGRIGDAVSKIIGAVSAFFRAFDPLICRKWPKVSIASTTFVWAKK